MDGPTDALLRRASSQTSAPSSRRSSTVRVRPRKYASNASLAPATTPSDKSFTSFPSLAPSPDASPTVTRIETPNFTSAPTSAAPLPSPVPSPPTVRRAPGARQRSIVGSLLGPSSAVNDRSALFDDVPPDPRDVPGTLHRASDEHIERELARNGAVALVRRLAEDLAQRDAHVTTIRRRAEERERILKKMLREREVSNRDIERRLSEGDGPPVNGVEVLQDTHAGASKRATTGTAVVLPRDHLSKRLSQALSDLQPGEVIDGTTGLGFPLGDTEDLEATIRASKDAPSGSVRDDASSLASFDDPTSDSRQAKEGWKSYLWGKGANKTESVTSRDENDSHGQTSQVSSGAQSKRKALNSDLFLPPATGMERTNSKSSLDRDSVDAEGGSRRSSLSVSSWAMKLVAGNKRTSRESEKQPASKDDDDQASPSNQEGARQSTLKGTPAATGGGESAKLRSSLRNILDASGTNRRKNKADSVRPLSNLRPTEGAQESLPRRHSNLGPVEMDMILPEESRPPALMQTYKPSTAGQSLTDRFGFIYDQRRKKRQSEAAAATKKKKRASNVESLSSARNVVNEAHLDEAGSGPLEAPQGSSSCTPPRTGSPVSAEEQGDAPGSHIWQDFLKLATFPTELLSHTPSTAPITAVDSTETETAPRISQVQVQKRGSMPVVSVNPKPSPSRIVSSNAEISQAAQGSTGNPTSPTSKQPDPVRALLDQLTELHDSLQKEKAVDWNEFLRKVRAERKREGASAAGVEGRASRSAMPEANLTDGEIIGVAALGIKGKVGRAKWNEFRNLVLGGIPVAYRAKIWAECSGASTLRVPGQYDDLVCQDAATADEAVAAQIQMDITRTLTDNVFFRSGPGVPKLQEVLLAYAARDSDVGYCQGMNLIAGSLLLILPTAEDAFWILASLIENILPSSYYDHSLLTSRADQQVLRGYVAELLPRLSAHLDDLSIELEALTFQWFLSVFTDCLSAEALFRVWDVVLCMGDGSTFLFQVALALLKLNERALVDDCRSPAEVYHYINHQMTNHAISIDGLIHASDALKNVVRRADVEQRRGVAVENERKVMRQREELRQERARVRAAASITKHGGDEGSRRNEGERRHDESAIDEATLRIITADSASEASKGSNESASLSLATPLARSTPRLGSPEQEPRAMENMRSPHPVDEEVEWRA